MSLAEAPAGRTTRRAGAEGTRKPPSGVPSPSVSVHPSTAGADGTRKPSSAGAEGTRRPPSGRGPGAVAVDLERVRKVAGSVRDPEVRTPIADLGLLDEVEADGGRVTVRFHLTSPLCPAKFAGAIGQDIRRRVGKLPGVESVEVVLQDHFMAEALHRLINEGDRSAETRGLLR